MIKKLVQVFLYDLTENPNELFGQPNITSHKNTFLKGYKVMTKIYKPPNQRQIDDVKFHFIL